MKKMLNKLIYRNRFTEDETNFLLEKGLLVSADRKTAGHKLEDLHFHSVCRKEGGRILWLED